MRDTKVIKFETLIEEIESHLKHIDQNGRLRSSMPTVGVNSRELKEGNPSLDLIYDYNLVNDYAKAIMDKSTYECGVHCYMNEDNFWVRGQKKRGFADEEKKIRYSKEFVQFCKMNENVVEGYKFIFWSLMILTVEKTDAEKHLSMVCDFAQMFGITDDEFEDIIRVIRIVYQDTEAGAIRTSRIEKIFRDVIKPPKRLWC
nr:hypothetical protein [Eubacterium sp.]